MRSMVEGAGAEVPAPSVGFATTSPVSTGKDESRLRQCLTTKKRGTNLVTRGEIV